MLAALPRQALKTLPLRIPRAKISVPGLNPALLLLLAVLEVRRALFPALVMCALLLLERKATATAIITPRELVLATLDALPVIVISPFPRLT